MTCTPRRRTRSRHHDPLAEGEADRPTVAPRVVTVYRDDDDMVCHGRCRRPLSLHGIRGLLEADFYCYTCLSHVTIPLTVLRNVVFRERAEELPKSA